MSDRRKLIYWLMDNPEGSGKFITTGGVHFINGRINANELKQNNPKLYNLISNDFPTGREGEQQCRETRNLLGLSMRDLPCGDDSPSRYTRSYYGGKSNKQNKRKTKRRGGKRNKKQRRNKRNTKKRSRKHR